MIVSFLPGQVRGDFLHERAANRWKDLKLSIGEVPRGDAEPKRAQLPHFLPTVLRNGRRVEKELRHY